MLTFAADHGVADLAPLGLPSALCLGLLGPVRLWEGWRQSEGSPRGSDRCLVSL